MIAFFILMSVEYNHLVISHVHTHHRSFIIIHHHHYQHLVEKHLFLPDPSSRRATVNGVQMNSAFIGTSIIVRTIIMIRVQW